MIPEMNGWEVCRCLKREPETSGIPVIMVSGRVEEGGKVLGFELGADDYVTKPRNVDVHMARLRSKFLDAKVELPGVETVRGVGYRFPEADAVRL